MKRSEIIKFITKTVNKRIEDNQYELLDAEDLLYDLEKLGMLPPPISKPLKYHNGKQLQVEYVNQWESEDA